MTDLSTANIQRLLDQATPGPWTYVPGDAPDERLIGNSDTMTPCIAIEANGEGSDCNDSDLTLAALAPELAQEVLRMREELNSMKRAWLFMTIEPHLSGLERTLATQALNSIDEVLGDHDG